MTVTLLLAYLVIFLGAVNLVRMGLFMVGSDLYSIKQALDKKRAGASSYFPTISVVIPAHNEEHTVIRAIESILESTYPAEKREVIVVDDGSTDHTAALVTEYLKDPRFTSVRLVAQKNSGKAHALNNAVQNYATGELVMCLDADSYIAPNALTHAARYFTDKRVVALASNVKIRNTGTLLNLIQQFEYLVCYQMKRAQTFYNVEYIIGGIGSTFRRDALVKASYYDTDTVTEDIDLTLKLIREGNKDARVIYGSDVVTYTEGVLNISGLIRQRFRWKHGRSQTFLKNTELFFSRNQRHNKFLTWGYLPFALFCDLAFFLEPLVVGYLLYIIVLYSDWVTLASAFAIIGAYVALNVLAEDTIPWRERIKLALIAPSMYFFFYVLSFVEYVALIKSYSKAGSLVRGTGADDCRWEHVERTDEQGAPVGIFARTGARWATALVILVLIPGGWLALRATSFTSALPQEKPAVTVTAPRETTHVVQKGEYLRSIAKRYYGDEAAWTSIEGIENPDLIYPGDVLVISGH